MPIPLLRPRTWLLWLLRALRMPMPEYCLIAMRLEDMHVVHPSQDNTRSCDECQQILGIYPSGQAALKRWPDARLLCPHCANVDNFDETMPAAQSREEFLAERRMSQPRGRPF